MRGYTGNSNLIDVREFLKRAWEKLNKMEKKYLVGCEPCMCFFFFSVKTNHVCVSMVRVCHSIFMLKRIPNLKVVPNPMEKVSWSIYKHAHALAHPSFRNFDISLQFGDGSNS